MTTQLVDARRGAGVTAHLLIAGERVDGAARLEVRNPARPEEVVGTIVRGTPADVDAAVAAAKAAQPAWWALGFRARAAAIARGLDELARDMEERAVLHVRENGKTLGEARGLLVGLADRQRTLLEYVDALEHVHVTEAPAGRTAVVYRPYGVALSIVPWNAPVTLAFSQIVSALFAGNAIVVKPPETAPLALVSSVEAFARELPRGLVNVVTGVPEEIGDALTTHPDIGKIGFTGSIRAARRIGANAAQTVKSVTFELGGNDPAILLDDADLGDATMNRMVANAYFMAGQYCMAIKRIFVPESLAGAFLEAFRRAVDRIVVGDGLVPGVTMGPLHSQAQLTRATAFVDDARARGANVETLGSIEDDAVFARGYFMQPTIVTNIAADAPLVADEQFCPSVPILTYRDVEEALANANDTIYGLGGSVWSRDLDRAARIASRIASGMVSINTHGGPVSRHVARGGVKQSGIGRKLGLEGILDYLETQTLTTYAGP